MKTTVTAIACHNDNVIINKVKDKLILRPMQEANVFLTTMGYYAGLTVTYGNTRTVLYKDDEGSHVMVVELCTPDIPAKGNMDMSLG